MKTNTIVVSVLVAGVLMAGASAMAREHGSTRRAIKSPEASKEARASKTPNPVNAACVGAAVSVREAALGTGVGKFGDAIKSAYSARASSLATAYNKTTSSEIRTAVKAAWTQFSTSSKTAGREWKATQKSAWSEFRTATKACRGSSEVSDEKNSSQEGSIWRLISR